MMSTGWMDGLDGSVMARHFSVLEERARFHSDPWYTCGLPSYLSALLYLRTRYHADFKKKYISQAHGSTRAHKPPNEVMQVSHYSRATMFIHIHTLEHIHDAVIVIVSPRKARQIGCWKRLGQAKVMVFWWLPLRVNFVVNFRQLCCSVQKFWIVLCFAVNLLCK